MKALQFKAILDGDRIRLPKRVFSKLKNAGTRPVSVIVLYEETGEEEAFKALGRQQFLEGYASEDAIYDQI
jgi:hypothetical protein